MVKKPVKYKNTTNKVLRLRLIINGGNVMATQIAATPVIYGREAKIILQESKSQPSEKAQENERKLLDFFKRITT